MRVLSVNTGTVRSLGVAGRSFPSAIAKASRAGPVAVGPLGLSGDEQADPSVHGGLDKAVYAYASEHWPFWQEQRRAHGVSLFDEPPGPGLLGENLSLQGLLESALWIGDELHFPACVLRVTAPREPCFKLNAALGLPQAGRLMLEQRCPGFYLAVQQPGPIEAGQGFEVRRGPRGLSVLEAFAAKRVKHLR